MQRLESENKEEPGYIAFVTPQTKMAGNSDKQDHLNFSCH